MVFFTAVLPFTVTSLAFFVKVLLVAIWTWKPVIFLRFVLESFFQLAVRAFDLPMGLVMVGLGSVLE